MSKLDDLRIDAPPARPRRRRRLPWVPIVTLLFACAVVLYVERERVAEFLAPRDSATAPAEEPGAIAAQLTPASAVNVPPGGISAAGYLEVIPPGPTLVSALVAGRIDELLVVPGASVEAGEVLARLDTGQLRQEASRLASRVELARRELERQQAGFRSQEIEQAEAAVSAANARLELAQSNLQRGMDLFDKGVIARQEYEKLQADVREAEAGVAGAESSLSLYQSGTRSEDIEIARARLTAAQAELSAVQWEIGQCTISSPVSGVVLEQYAHPGAWVAPGGDDPLTGAVVSIFDPARLQAWVDVNQRDSAVLFVGQRVELTTDALPQRPVAGTVSRIMPQANLQKNTVQVKIEIPEPPEDFRPELSVKVVFLPPAAEAGAEEPQSNEPGDDSKEAGHVS